MVKKYVSIEKLGLYDEKIKKYISDADAAILTSTQEYADGLADNYEAAGSIATAKEEIQGKIDAVDSKVDAAQAAADGAQGEVDALETYVGTIPATATATNIVAYVQEKTSGIATDAALGELTGRVTQAETDIDNIEKDYLKAADKTELSEAIAAETSRADTAEKANAAAIKAISDDYLKGTDKTALQEGIDGVAADVATIAGDYLKASDKTELQGKIDLKAAQTALEAEVERATGVEESLQTQINTIMNNPETEGVIDSINEFTQYIADHGAIADGFRTDINKNAADIAAEVKRAGEAETALSGRLDTLEAIEHDAYVAADTALETKLNAEIAKKATTETLNDAVEALEGADADLSDRITAIEDKFGGADGSVEDQIADAAAEAQAAAEATAAADATSKANAAEAAAKGHADSLNTAMNTRVEALEAIDHEHSNKALLDTYTQTEANLADAVAKKHEHSNLTVLEGITAAKVSAWDAAEGNAKTYADGLNTAMDARVVTLETWHNNFTECSEEEINALFQQ